MVPGSLNKTKPKSMRSLAKTDTISEDSGQEPVESCVASQKRMRRILANRSSARASYLRRKKNLVELQMKISELGKKNEILEGENRNFREEIEKMERTLHLRLVATTPGQSSPLLQPRGPMFDALSHFRKIPHSVTCGILQPSPVAERLVRLLAPPARPMSALSQTLHTADELLPLRRQHQRMPPPKKR
jgi:hypothetical protein